MLRDTSSYRLQDINPRVFWDMDLETLDYERNAPLIIQRVLEYGDLKDWYAIKKHYGHRTSVDLDFFGGRMFFSYGGLLFK